MATNSTARQTGGANLGFEATLWAAADKLRGHRDAAEYKHVVPGLIFLKYISDAFGEIHTKLKGVLPKNYARPDLNKQQLGEGIDLIAMPAKLGKTFRRNLAALRLPAETNV